MISVRYSDFSMVRDDDATPATKKDLRDLRDVTGKAIQGIRDDMQAISKSLHEAIDQVLVVLINMDKRLTMKANEHEQRIVRLEEHVGIAA